MIDGPQVGQKVAFSADVMNGQMVSEGLPRLTNLTALGYGWNIQTSTLFAPLVAVPTTVAALELWNNIASGKTMVVNTLFAEQILATAAAQTYGIYAMVTTAKAVPTLTALSTFSNNGQSAITPVVGSDIVTGVGTTVVANGWRPFGVPQAWGTATATPGNAWNVPIEGELVVPPGSSLCLHVVGALATASTFQVGASVFMVPKLF